MTRPDAIMFKGEYVATQMTEHEKDIWELGQVAGIATALNNLRAQVEALPPTTYTYGDAPTVLLADVPEATCDHTDCFNPGRHDYESVLLCDAHDRILNLQLRNDVLTERLDRMRVEVEALDHAWDCDSDKPRGAGMSCDCPIKDVLALIDGSSDG